MGNISGGLSLLALLIPGFLFNNLILGKKRTWESIALSWISGGVLFTLGLYVCNNLLNIRLNLINSWVVLILLTILLFVLNNRTNLFLYYQHEMRPTRVRACIHFE